MILLTYPLELLCEDKICLIVKKKFHISAIPNFSILAVPAFSGNRDETIASARVIDASQFTRSISTLAFPVF